MLVQRKSLQSLLILLTPSCPPCALYRITKGFILESWGLGRNGVEDPALGQMLTHRGVEMSHR